MQLRRWIQVARGRAGLVDGLLVLVVGAVQVLGVLAASGRIGVSPNWPPLDGWGYLLMVVGALALLVRRRWPLGVLAVTVAVSLAYASRAYPEGPAAVAVYPALYTVVTLVPRRRAWLAGAATAVAVGRSEVAFYGDTMFDGEPLYAAFSVVAFVWLAEAVRARRAYVAELRDGPSWPSGPGRRRRPAAGSTRSACASPGSCTTSCRTPSA
jgi:hypothetical protein